MSEFFNKLYKSMTSWAAQLNGYIASNSTADSNGRPTIEKNKVFSMIDNYVYLYHTGTLIAIPTFPEQIDDSMGTAYNSTSLLSRSAPIFSYSNSGPRSMQISLHLHRDMMDEINTNSSLLNIDNLSSVDYLDRLIRELQSAALPKYSTAEKMVNPPLVAVRFGEDIFCKGVIDGGVSVSYSGPILSTNKYAEVSINFSIKEVDPYDADTIQKLSGAGSYRGISTDLEGIVWGGTK